MKDVRRLIVLLALAFTLVLVPAGTVQGKKPFRFEVSGGKTLDGWEGTIDSGPLIGKTMIWVTEVMEVKGQRVYFFETWEIKDGDTLILAGFDKGVTRLKNGEFTGNGRVTKGVDDTKGDWSDLIGCKEHVGGTVDFVDPLDPMTWAFTGTVQIN